MTDFFNDPDRGDFLPSIRWGSDAVKWTTFIDKVEATIDPKQAIFDIDQLKIGWICIGNGRFEQILAHKDAQIPERPAETKTVTVGDVTKVVAAFDKGFSVNVLLGKEFGDVRLFEFSTSQKGSFNAMRELDAQYDNEYPSNNGKVPVVEFGPHTHVKMGKGSSNIPGLKIVKWVVRPAELDMDTSIAVSEVAAAAPPVAAAADVSEF